MEIDDDNTWKLKDGSGELISGPSFKLEFQFALSGASETKAFKLILEDDKDPNLNWTFSTFLKEGERILRYIDVQNEIYFTLKRET